MGHVSAFNGKCWEGIEVWDSMRSAGEGLQLAFYGKCQERVEVWPLMGTAGKWFRVGVL